MKLWGEDRPLESLRLTPWRDILVGLALAGFLFGLIHLARQRTGPISTVAEIDLAPWALPYYALLSLSRCLLACLLSVGFALVFGSWTVKDPVANRFIVPIVDTFRRSVPTLGLMPVLVMALAAVFPGSRLGLELSALVLLFMAQFWPITSSFRHALRAVPAEQKEMASAYHFSNWQRLRWVELPCTVIGLIWNSILGMSRGWFVLMASESLVMDQQDYRLPGIGSYLREAVEQQQPGAIIAALAAMLLLIVLLNELLWQPLLVWAQKFRQEEQGGGEERSSWFLERLEQWQRLPLLTRAGTLWHRWRRYPSRMMTLRAWRRAPPGPETTLAALKRARRSGLAWPRVALARWMPWAGRGLFLALLIPLLPAAWQLIMILSEVTLHDWLMVTLAGLTTLGRVILAVGMGTLIAVPAGLVLGLSPRWAHFLQPGAQVLVSFPTTLLFPLLIAAFARSGISLGWGSIVLMFLPAQAYILFNTLAGSMEIPADLQEAVRSYRVGLWHRFWMLYMPAVFPHLVRGWDAAMGVAWSTSVIAESTTLNQEVFQTWGLGAWISTASSHGQFAHLAAGVFVMVFLRETFNRLVWDRCYRLARERYSMNR